ncbi:D-aminoacyl-tRNA deacylase [Alloalcanivorax xenomutans]|uniref:D-aminoacyl-tRNA deacylase n=1 Tax=Alloalcanivorax xenomutans TaxID=1094342 RepID=UPI0003B8A327|nr:D-aminoacyl-tRNA deacylase [Alloalcanivorax xenomutans]ERS10148.1 D-tyrosyl-tRNA(Tyr) deacylase [Alcanivorax sp. PN-3]WOA32069.1 D-aminoacyl-tRNA deacylase [Alloalcanivorax xenomutans]SOB91327.1 D-tyrosyl-tRNA(Tyr) deacylase [Alloalcanivorax xenomutans]
MKVLLQRVREARVEVAGEEIGRIGRGLLVFVGVERGDASDTARRLAERLAGYRVFADEQGKMNLDVRDVAGEVLAVSQFTLAADTRKGRRPGFSGAAEPGQGLRLYQEFVDALTAHQVPVATGRFGADMQVHLINDGPVTFLLEL